MWVLGQVYSLAFHDWSSEHFVLALDELVPDLVLGQFEHGIHKLLFSDLTVSVYVDVARARDIVPDRVHLAALCLFFAPRRGQKGLNLRLSDHTCIVSQCVEGLLEVWLGELDAMLNGHLDELKVLDRARFICIDLIEEWSEVLLVGHALHVFD